MFCWLQTVDLPAVFLSSLIFQSGEGIKGIDQRGVVETEGGSKEAGEKERGERDERYGLAQTERLRYVT